MRILAENLGCSSAYTPNYPSRWVDRALVSAPEFANPSNMVGIRLETSTDWLIYGHESPNVPLRSRTYSYSMEFYLHLRRK